jgi:ABC-type transporter MlaC component
MRRLKFFTVMLLVGLPLTSMAQPYPPYRGYQQPPQIQSHPGVVLREGIEKVLAFLEGGGAANRDRLVSFVDRELAGYFDFVSMSRSSMGMQLRYMNPEQRTAAVGRLRTMFLEALVRQLADYEVGRIEYLRPRGNPYSNEMILGMQSFPRSGFPQQLDFYFHRGRDGWKVYDVAANGLRATSVYREYFARELRPNRSFRGYPAR